MNFDPITLEVLRHALAAAAEEMAITLVRTALSPVIREQHNFSTGVYTPDGSLVAQAEHMPLHLGVMPHVVRSVLATLPCREMAPGDAVIINDPHISGSHLPAVCVITPVFFNGQPLALVANLAHHVDLGGAVPGSMATNTTAIFQEGIRIPPLKICHKGKLSADLVKLIAHNVRTPAEFQGNLQAQITANRQGEQRLLGLAARYGPHLLRHYLEQIIDYTERRLRAALAAIPQGIYRSEDYLEGDGLSQADIPIKVTVTAGGDSLHIDFSGTAPQAAGPVNATRPVTMACVYYVVKSCTDPDIPSNEGISRPLTVITPPGTLVNADFPAPVAQAGTNTAQRIADVLVQALGQAVPARVTAAGTGSMSSITIGGIHPATGRYYSYVETHGGGQGAKHNQDGMDGVHVHMTNALNTPVEITEQLYPLRVERYALRPGSGGAGTHRGGLGLVREITVLDHEAVVSVSTDRVRHKPLGLAGGQPGENARCTIKTPALAKANPAPTGKFSHRVPPGTVITLETAGGGGFGDPANRSTQALERDYLEGFCPPNNKVPED